jgi:hypothetical protein
MWPSFIEAAIVLVIDWPVNFNEAAITLVADASGGVMRCLDDLGNRKGF